MTPKQIGNHIESRIDDEANPDFLERAAGCVAASSELGIECTIRTRKSHSEEYVDLLEAAPGHQSTIDEPDTDSVLVRGRIRSKPWSVVVQY